MLLRLLVVLVFAGLSTIDLARCSPRFQRFSFDDGLSDLTINAIVQDSAGFLWIGTRNGLNRFDGVRFRIFLRDPTDSTSLVNDDVKHLLVDSRGTLWIGTSQGLCTYDPLHERFHRVRLSDAASEASEDINGLVEDQEGCVWIGITGGGILQCDPRTLRFVRYVHNPSDSFTLSSNTISELVLDRDGYLWAGTLDNGLNRLDTKTGKVTRFLHLPGSTTSIGGGRIETLTLDHNGTVWIGTQYGGLNKYVPASGSFERFVHNPSDPASIPVDWVSVVYADNDERLWVGTQGGGVCLFDRHSGRFESFQTDAYASTSISDPFIQSVFQDRNGNVWVGTGSGLNKVLRFSMVFRHVGNQPGKALLPHQSIHAALKDGSGNVWIGTKSGLTRISIDGARARHLPLPVRQRRPLSPIGVNALWMDSKGTLWVGTNGSGVFLIPRYEQARDFPDLTRFGSTSTFDSSFTDDAIWCVYEDRRGTMWFGTENNGLFERSAGGSPRRYAHDPQDETSISDNTITTLFEDQRGLLWVGTMRGLNALDPTTHAFTRYVHNALDPNSLPHRSVFGIAEDRLGRLWVATARGLAILDTLRKSFRTYLTQDGLADVFLKGLLAENDSMIWISSRNGLTRALCDAAGNISFTNYGASDGLPVVDFNPLAFSRSNDGEIFFGGSNGLVCFFPRLLQRRRSPSPIVLTSFRVSGNIRPLSSGLMLTHSENHVEFEFAGLDISSPQKHRFAYMLKGLDTSWHVAGSSRSAQYSNLAPDTYTFIVRGTAEDWMDSLTTATFVFTIRPAYWQTWSFRAIVLATIVLMLWLGYRYRMRQLVAIERLRLRISSDLHDELASNLSSIALLGSIVAEGDSQHDEHRLIERMTALAQDSLASLRHIIWAIDPKGATLDAFLTRLIETMTPICRAQRITLTISALAQHHGRVPLKPDQRQHLWLLLKEAITNAIKHSRASHVTIQTGINGDELHIVVADDGIGFDVVASAQGKGLGTMRMRAQLLRGSLHIDSAPGMGTQLILHMKR